MVSVRGSAQVDSYFAGLEQRYAGEIARRFGATVESPVTTFNRPVHRGDFGLRIPPSQRALTECVTQWRAWLPAARTYQVAVSPPGTSTSPPSAISNFQALRDRIRINFTRLRQDRFLDEARETAGPVRLMRLFGITSHTAIHYFRAAHPECSTIDATQA